MVWGPCVLRGGGVIHGNWLGNTYDSQVPLERGPATSTTLMWRYTTMRAPTPPGFSRTSALGLRVLLFFRSFGHPLLSARGLATRELCVLLTHEHAHTDATVGADQAGVFSRASDRSVLAYRDDAPSVPVRHASRFRLAGMVSKPRAQC